jgi:putative membrane protein (TIGR04086 family)
MAGTRLLWGRIIAGAFGVEAALIPFAIAAQPLGQDALTAIALVGAFILSLLMGMWAARRAPGRFVLHGALVGIGAMLIYLALAEAGRRWGPPTGPQPFAYQIAHALKLLGGSLGGWLAQRRALARASHPQAT